MCNEKLIELAKKGDKEACELIITENTGLVWSIVRRYFGRGLEADDLFQLGCIGLIKAVDGFDVGFGTKFSTYAVPKIAGEIRRFLRDDGMIKVSRTVKDNAYKISQIKMELETKFGREPRLSELSEASGFTMEEIAVCENAFSGVESLQKETSDNGLTLEQTIGSDGIEDKIIEKETLREAIKQLPQREQTIILLRFYKGITQDRIAHAMHISQVQVSRIEKKAIEMIKMKIG